LPRLGAETAETPRLGSATIEDIYDSARPAFLRFEEGRRSQSAFRSTNNGPATTVGNSSSIRSASVPAVLPPATTGTYATGELEPTAPSLFRSVAYRSNATPAFLRPSYAQNPFAPGRYEASTINSRALLEKELREEISAQVRGEFENQVHQRVQALEEQLALEMESREQQRLQEFAREWDRLREQEQHLEAQHKLDMRRADEAHRAEIESWKIAERRLIEQNETRLVETEEVIRDMEQSLREKEAQVQEKLTEQELRFAELFARQRQEVRQEMLNNEANKLQTEDTREKGAKANPEDAGEIAGSSMEVSETLRTKFRADLEAEIKERLTKQWHAEAEEWKDSVHRHFKQEAESQLAEELQAKLNEQRSKLEEDLKKELEQVKEKEIQEEKQKLRGEAERARVAMTVSFESELEAERENLRRTLRSTHNISNAATLTSNTAKSFGIVEDPDQDPRVQKMLREAEEGRVQRREQAIREHAKEEIRAEFQSQADAMIAAYEKQIKQLTKERDSFRETLQTESTTAPSASPSASGSDSDGKVGGDANATNASVTPATSSAAKDQAAKDQARKNSWKKPSGLFRFLRSKRASPSDEVAYAASREAATSSSTPAMPPVKDPENDASGANHALGKKGSSSYMTPYKKLLAEKEEWVAERVKFEEALQRKDSELQERMTLMKEHMDSQMKEQDSQMKEQMLKKEMKLTKLLKEKAANEEKLSEEIKKSLHQEMCLGEYEKRLAVAEKRAEADRTRVEAEYNSLKRDHEEQVERLRIVC